MKQYLLLLSLSAFGVIGSFWWTPYCGVVLYYMFAVMRPQYLWKWQLAGAPVLLPWSFMVAVAAIAGYIAWAGGLMSFGKQETSLMRFRAKFTVAHWAMMAFAAQICLSFFLSNSMEQSQNWFGEYLKIFGMYLLASRVVRTAGQVRGLYLLVTLAISYVAWEMNAIYLQTGKLIIARDGFAGLDNNGAGLLLALAVPLCYFAWEFTAHRLRWVFLLLIPVIVHAVGSSYSRGAMLSIIAAIPFYFVYSRKRKMLTVLTLIGLASLPVLFGKEIQARFFSVDKTETDDSFQVRVQSWKIAVEIANDYPLAGAGIRCSNAEMKGRGADMEGRTIHSQYLQIAADSGWPALVLYIIMVVSTFYTIWKARYALWSRKDPESIRAVAMLGGIECALISFLIGAFALSLEVFEIAYLLFFMGAQVWGLVNATDTAAGQVVPVQYARVPMPAPARRPAFHTVDPRGRRR